jgi:hypothetical protein
MLTTFCAIKRSVINLVRFMRANTVINPGSTIDTRRTGKRGEQLFDASEEQLWVSNTGIPERSGGGGAS